MTILIYLFEKFFISPSVLNDDLVGESILNSKVFLFRTFNISYHSFLACNISSEKSANSFIVVPLYSTLSISCWFQNSFFFFTINFLDLIILLYGSVLLVWDLLCFLFLDICFILSVWEFFSHNMFKYILNPLLSFFSCWKPYTVDVETLDIFWRSHMLLLIFFSFVFLSAVLTG